MQPAAVPTVPSPYQMQRTNPHPNPQTPATMKTQTNPEPATVVHFRKWKDGQIIALFPNIDEGQQRCSSYEHNGQHSPANYTGVLAHTYPVSLTAPEVVALSQELTAAPYFYNLTPLDGGHLAAPQAQPTEAPSTPDARASQRAAQHLAAQAVAAAHPFTPGLFFDLSRGAAEVGEMVQQLAALYLWDGEPEDAESEFFNEAITEAETHLNTIAPEGHFFGYDEHGAGFGLWEAGPDDEGRQDEENDAEPDGPANVPAAVPTAADLDTFTRDYLAAGLQLMEADDEPGGSIYDIEPAELARIVKDCQQFQQVNAADLAAGTADEGQAGTDYWLTRNGHGAGFWDRPELYGDAEAERLSEAARAAGPADLYTGDDGKIYMYPPDMTTPTE